MMGFLKKNPFKGATTPPSQRKKNSKPGNNTSRKSLEKKSAHQKWSRNSSTTAFDVEQQEEIAVLMRISNFKLELLRSYPSRDIRRTVVINNLLNELCNICDRIIASSVASGQLIDPDFVVTPPSKLTMLNETSAPEMMSANNNKSSSSASSPSENYHSSQSTSVSSSLSLDLQPDVVEGFPAFGAQTASSISSRPDFIDEIAPDSPHPAFAAAARRSLGRTPKSLPRHPHVEDYIDLKDELMAAPFVPSPLAPQEVQNAAASNANSNSQFTFLRRKKSILANGRILVDFSSTSPEMTAATPGPAEQNVNSTVSALENWGAPESVNSVPSVGLSRSKAVRKPSSSKSIPSISEEELHFNKDDTTPSIQSESEPTTITSRPAVKRHASETPKIRNTSPKTVNRRKSIGFFEMFVNAFVAADSQASQHKSDSRLDSNENTYAASDRDRSTVLIVDEADTMEYETEFPGMLDTLVSEDSGMNSPTYSFHAESESISVSGDTVVTDRSQSTPPMQKFNFSPLLNSDAFSNDTDDSITPTGTETIPSVVSNIKTVDIPRELDSCLTPPAAALLMARAPLLDTESLSPVPSRPKVFQSAFTDQLTGQVLPKAQSMFNEPLSYVSLHPVTSPSQQQLPLQKSKSSASVSHLIHDKDQETFKPVITTSMTKASKGLTKGLFHFSKKKAASTSDLSGLNTKSVTKSRGLGFTKRLSARRQIIVDDDSDLDEDDFDGNEVDIDAVLGGSRYA